MPAHGIETTLRTLLRSANPAATRLLLVAAGSDDPMLRVGAVRALALRDDADGHRELVERLHELPPDASAALGDVSVRSPLAASLPRFIDQAAPNRSRYATRVAADWSAFSVLPTIVEAVAWPGDLGPALAADMLRLAEKLAARVAAYDPRVTADGAPHEEDPAFDRRAAVNALSSALRNYDRHERREVIDATLLLAPTDEPALVDALHNPTVPAYQPLRDALRNSRSRGALSVLAHVLLDARAPKDVLQIACERFDADALGTLLGEVGYPVGLRARENAKRIEGFAWLDPSRVVVLVELPGEVQGTAVTLAAASSANRAQVADAIGLLLAEGTGVGPLAAARAIKSLPTRLALEPLEAALESDDPRVVAAAAELLRSKEHPQATEILVRLLDWPDEAVRRSAQKSLGSLSFSAFRNQRESLSPEQQRQVGELISKADPMAATTLASELRSGAAGRRMAALELLETMGLAAQMTEAIVERMTDPDAGVRAEAARLLGRSWPSETVLSALQAAVEDPSAPVRREAKQSLATLDGLVTQPAEDWK